MRTVTYDAEQQALVLVDQTRLPAEFVRLACRTPEEVAEAIRQMRVRGAPAIGVAAAYGLALGVEALTETDSDAFVARADQIAAALLVTRPTAVNLRWALEREMTLIRDVATRNGIMAARAAALDLARQMEEEDVAVNRRMGQLGLDLIPQQANVLTHCNTGALATVDYGTALGVIRTAHEAGKQIHVFADETRPFLQGARLTTWELQQLGVPMTLITDSMAGHFMARGQVDLVIVGADRIAANGDVANKIGTYTLAVLAKEHGIPFYVVAPTSTVDLAVASGQDIPIEERSVREVVEIGGTRIAPEGVQAAHPAFDVTPARYVTAIVTEQGVVRAPFAEGLKAVVVAAQQETAGATA